MNSRVSQLRLFLFMNLFELVPKMVGSTSTGANGRYIYIYIHDDVPRESIDTHHIVVRRNAAKGLIFNLFALLLISSPFVLFAIAGKSICLLLWSLLLIAFLVKSFFWKPVEKESVTIMPDFGVQLETHYRSGKTIRRFVPISKISKAVLNECVTPVTCYWTLSLLVSGEEELELVFKELHPPVKMLVPIWKALNARPTLMVKKDPKPCM